MQMVFGKIRYSKLRINMRDTESRLTNRLTAMLGALEGLEEEAFDGPFDGWPVGCGEEIRTRKHGII